MTHSKLWTHDKIHLMVTFDDLERAIDVTEETTKYYERKSAPVAETSGA